MGAVTREFTQILVGAYDAQTGALIAVAMGTYDGSSDTITVAFTKPIPEGCKLKAFCVDDTFAPQYQASELILSD